MNVRVLAKMLACLFLTLVLVGCGNPADNKPVAQVDDAAPAPAGVADGARVYTASSDSTLNWEASKVTQSHEGGFKTFTGTFSVTGGDVTAGQINISIDTTSIWSDSNKLTGHLKSDDFFAVETYPTSTFTSTKIEKNETGYAVTGNFELHGVTKSIVFPAQITMTGSQVTLQAEFSINRMDFGIIYRGMANNLIREEVLLKLDFKASI